MEIFVVEGDITEQRVDVLVNAINSSLRLEHGVARAVREAAGGEIQAELLENAPEEVEGGTVIQTGGYSLYANTVCHAVAVPLTLGASESSIRRATQNALETADVRTHSSIALPALGCGISSYPIHKGARVICEEITSFDSRYLTEALLVGYSADEHEIMRSVAWKVRTGDTR